MKAEELKSKFGVDGKIVLPVIHLFSIEQTLTQAELAMDCGAHGVFVIDHGGTDLAMDGARAIKESHGDVFVGVNDLGGMPQAVMFDATESHIDGVWADDAYMVEYPVGSQYDAYSDAKYMFGDKHELPLYFGGVAFKYTMKRHSNLEVLSRASVGHMDVITTSGDATGKAPTVEKISAMRKGIGEEALAIASGVSAENIAAFDANAFLVASSISSGVYHFDAGKIRELVAEAARE